MQFSSIESTKTKKYQPTAERWQARANISHSNWKSRAIAFQSTRTTSKSWQNEWKHGMTLCFQQIFCGYWSWKCDPVLVLHIFRGICFFFLLPRIRNANESNMRFSDTRFAFMKMLSLKIVGRKAVQSCSSRCATPHAPNASNRCGNHINTLGKSTIRHAYTHF